MRDFQPRSITGPSYKQRFGNYHLIKKLGRGGFAEVYLGTHHYLGTHAAVKVLPTGFAEIDLQAFLNEARIAAHLIHPHMIRVLEFGVESQVPFLVMDYAPHGTLRQLHPQDHDSLRRQRLDM